jgi:hypothetical protein
MRDNTHSKLIVLPNVDTLRIAYDHHGENEDDLVVPLLRQRSSQATNAGSPNDHRVLTGHRVMETSASLDHDCFDRSRSAALLSGTPPRGATHRGHRNNRVPHNEQARKHNRT